MKSYKAISRKTGKELIVELGLVEKINHVNIGGERMERKSGIFEPVGKAVIKQLGITIKDNVQIYMIDNKLIFKASNGKINIDAFVEGAVEIENYFIEKEANRKQEQKEYIKFQREMNL